MRRGERETKRGRERVRERERERERELMKRGGEMCCKPTVVEINSLKE